MNFLQYALAAVIAFSGLIVGVFLARFTKEEMPTGSRYFPLLQKIIFMAIAVVLLSTFNIALPIKAAIYAIIVILLLRFYSTSFYPLLGVAFFLLGQQSATLFEAAVLVFLYGFPVGSLSASGKKINTLETLKKVVVQHSLFLIVAIGLQLVYLFLAE